jgi:RimJ/RimL family protein N-acetyltransferase
MTSRRPPPIPAGADAPILTARLLLQPVVEADAEALAELFCDERMYRFTGGQRGTLDELRASFARIQADRADDRDRTAQRNWTVRRRADGQAVGMLQAVLGDEGHSAELAWAVGVPWQGQGIASEAAQAVVVWLEARGLDTITAHINPDHRASIAVAAHAGLQPTEEFREHRGIREQLWRRQPTAEGRSLPSLRTPNFAPDGRQWPGETVVRTAVSALLLARRKSGVHIPSPPPHHG